MIKNNINNYNNKTKKEIIEKIFQIKVKSFQR